MSTKKELVIVVRDTGLTHIARAEGKTASCTHDWSGAVRAIVPKIWPGVEFDFREVPDSRREYKTYVATPKGAGA